MKKTKDQESKQLHTLLKQTTLQDSARRWLSEKTAFQQGLAVEAITHSFFVQNHKQAGPKVLTILAHDIEHAEIFARLFVRSLAVHLPIQPNIVDAGNKPHWNAVLDNRFTFCLVKEASDFLHPLLFGDEESGSRYEEKRVAEQAEELCRSLLEGKLRAPEKNVDYRAATFIFLEKYTRFRSKFFPRNLDDLNCAKKEAFKSLEPNQEQWRWNSHDYLEQEKFEFQCRGGISILSRASFSELLPFIGREYFDDEDGLYLPNARAISNISYGDIASKFVLALTCINAPGLTLANLTEKEERWAYDLTRDLASDQSTTENSEDAVICIDSGNGDNSANKYVNQLAGEQNIRLALISADPTPRDLSSILGESLKNAKLGEFTDTHNLGAFAPDLVVIHNASEDLAWARGIIKSARDIVPGAPCFLISETNIQTTVVEQLKTHFHTLVGVISLSCDFQVESFQHFQEFSRHIQLGKALHLQGVQRAVFATPSYEIRETSKHPVYHISLNRPLSRRAKVKDFFTVESEIQESLDDLIGADCLREALSRNLQQVLAGETKAMLIVGPPGCGKTFSVRALAGSSNIILISTTAANLEGQPATTEQNGHHQRQRQHDNGPSSRVEHIQNIARRHSPAIVLIDEAHFSLKNRDSHVTQALLSCLDGFEKDYRGVLWILLSSHSDIKTHPHVDPALFRAGRFREEVRVPLPDYRTREDYLLKHLPKLTAHEDLLKRIVWRSKGMSVADLKDLVGEIRYDLSHVGQSFQLTVDRQSLRYKHGITGDEHIFQNINDRSIWHEAGHAVVQMILFPEERIDCVTICQGGDSGGFVAPIEPDYPPLTTGMATLKRMAVGMAGRQSEIIGALMQGKMDPVDILNTCAGSDLSKVNGIAREAIFQYGLDPNYGPKIRSFGDENWKVLSEKDEAHIDRLLEKAESLARETLEDNPQLLKLVYANVKARGTLHQEDLWLLLDKARCES